MKDILSEERFDFISSADKDFILAFDDEMTRLGYDFGGEIGSGYGWGRHMFIYRKSGVKSEEFFARVHIRDAGATTSDAPRRCVGSCRVANHSAGVALRLFLNDVDRHRGFVEKTLAPPLAGRCGLYIQY